MNQASRASGGCCASLSNRGLGRRLALMSLSAMSMIGCSGSSAAAFDCGGIRDSSEALSQGDADAWRDLAEGEEGLGDDARLVASALEQPTTAETGRDAFGAADARLSAESGPLDRVRSAVRTECDIELENPFIEGAE